MPYSGPMFEFIETPSFTKSLEQYLDDDEYSRLQDHLNNHPESGVIVPGSGGVHKLRWRGDGRGSAVACDSSITCGWLAERSGC